MNYTVDSVRVFLTNLYVAAGLTDTDASYTAECMVQTNLWGVDSHGVLRTPIYVKRVRNGAITAKPTFTTVAGGDDKALEVVDGDAGIGYVVAREGMRRAIDKAKRFGAGTVLARNSNHFGAAALFARMAADEGMIGVAATNVMPNIGMKGNKKPSTGNNPIAMAAPLNEDYPFCLDISMSNVAGGKLLLASKKGDKIPKDWAVTAEGEETDDPDLGFKGFLLPVGAHKGFGMSLFIDIISGVASGGAFSRQIKSMYKSDEDPSLTCHIFYALDPACIMPADEFAERMAAWADEVRATPMTSEGATQIIPGQLEYETEQRRLAEGLPLPSELVEDLKGLAAEAGIDFDLEPV
jgi:LDH2 family malate/lactate/ureidoglycolate dehydrogenase